MGRYKNVYNKNIYSHSPIIATMPMPYFTPEELTPSEKTLLLIRQIAYTYRTININGEQDVFCLN